MQKCCENVQIQWYPDPQEPGSFNLGCAGCGTWWRPQSPEPVAPPVAPFEAQVISKLDAIMNEFAIEGAGPVAVASLEGMEGGGVYQTAWNNLEAALMTQKSWTKGKLATEIARVLAEAQHQGDQEAQENQEDQEAPF